MGGNSPSSGTCGLVAPQGCAWSLGARALAPAAYRFALTVRNTVSGKAAITAVAVTISAGLAPVVSIAAWNSKPKPKPYPNPNPHLNPNPHPNSNPHPYPSPNPNPNSNSNQVSIAATGFFAPRKVNPSDKLSLYGSATVSRARVAIASTSIVVTRVSIAAMARAHHGYTYYSRWPTYRGSLVVAHSRRRP